MWGFHRWVMLAFRAWLVRRSLYQAWIEKNRVELVRIEDEARYASARGENWIESRLSGKILEDKWSIDFLEKYFRYVGGNCQRREKPAPLDGTYQWVIRLSW